MRPAITFLNIQLSNSRAFSEHLATRAEIEQILPLLLDSYQIQ